MATLNDYIYLSPTDTDEVWEMFHENSKVGKYDFIPPNDYIAAQMQRMPEALEYEDCLSIPLPKSFEPFDLNLPETLVGRVTARKLAPCSLDLKCMAALLFYSYGITRDNTGTKFPHSFRTIPSGGALYPLEIYFSSKWIAGLDPGLYHYNPVKNCVEYIRQGDLSPEIADLLTPVQSNLAYDTAVMFFITGLFRRETFKYGPRGYRFVFLEAGHFAQNINLVSTAMKLGNVNICGYFDRETDKFLGIDGVSHSTIYMIGLGKRLPED